MPNAKDGAMNQAQAWFARYCPNEKVFVALVYVMPFSEHVQAHMSHALQNTVGISKLIVAMPKGYRSCYAASA